jgi:hypothetical protein
MVPQESVRESFITNFWGTHFHNLINKVRPTGLHMHKKPAKRCCVFTEEKQHIIGPRLENTPHKSLECLAQETCISKSSAALATKVLKLWSYNETVVHALQAHDPANRTNFATDCYSHVTMVKLTLAFVSISDEVWLYLHGYVSSQNSLYNTGVLLRHI